MPGGLLSSHLIISRRFIFLSIRYRSRWNVFHSYTKQVYYIPIMRINLYAYKSLKADILTPKVRARRYSASFHIRGAYHLGYRQPSGYLSPSPKQHTAGHVHLHAYPYLPVRLNASVPVNPYYPPYSLLKPWCLSTKQNKRTIQPHFSPG
jgi:hypothetical protein